MVTGPRVWSRVLRAWTLTETGLDELSVCKPAMRWVGPEGIIVDNILRYFA